MMLLYRKEDKKITETKEKKMSTKIISMEITHDSLMVV